MSRRKAEPVTHIAVTPKLPEQQMPRGAWVGLLVAIAKHFDLVVPDRVEAGEVE